MTKQEDQLNEIASRLTMNFFYILFTLGFFVFKFLFTFITDKSLMDSLKDIKNIYNDSVHESKELFKNVFKYQFMFILFLLLCFFRHINHLP